jgi:hypothetical protein
MLWLQSSTQLGLRPSGAPTAIANRREHHQQRRSETASTVHSAAGIPPATRAPIVHVLGSRSCSREPQAECRSGAEIPRKARRPRPGPATDAGPFLSQLLRYSELAVSDVQPVSAESFNSLVLRMQGVGRFAGFLIRHLGRRPSAIQNVWPGAPQMDIVGRQAGARQPAGHVKLE